MSVKKLSIPESPDHQEVTVTSRTDQEISLTIHQVILEVAVTSAFNGMGWASLHRLLFFCAVPVCASKHFLASPVGYLYERGDR